MNKDRALLLYRIQNCFLWVLLGLTVLRGVIYALLNPPFGSPDELHHYQYIAYLATGGASGPKGDEAHQPVGYYALMVPAYWATSTFPATIQLLSIRLFAIPLLLGTVFLAWLTARKIAPNRPSVAIVAAAIVSLHPQNVVITVSANNDSLANFWAALLIYLTVSLLYLQKASLSYLAIMASSIGAALLTKGQILSIVAISSAVLFVTVARDAFRARSWWLIVFPASALFLAGLALNTDAGSNLLVRAESHLSILWQGGDGLDAARRAGLRGPFSYLLVSFWSAFLGESVRPAAFWYLLPLTAIVVAAVGYLKYFYRIVKNSFTVSIQDLLIRGMLVLIILAQVVMVYLRYLQVFLTMPEWSWTLQVFQGRFLLVILVPLALLIAEGWSLLGSEKRQVQLSLLVVAMFTVFDAASIAALTGYYSWPSGN